MADFSRNQIIFSIQQYLSDIQQQSPSGVDLESLEVAVQCLKAAFSVDVGEEEHKKLYAISATLPQVFENGYFKQQKVSSNDNNNNKNEGNKADDVFEANFQKYLQVLTEKGYFNNVEVGSPEYNSRVQKAREKLEENEKANESKAEQKKLEGNNFVAAKQFNEAIQAYTEAISLCPRNPIYYANRAAAHSHLKQHSEAIEDCKLAISVDPNYSKAYSRMGLAYFSLGDYKGACESYRRAYELDPTDAIKQSLEIAEKKLKEKSGEEVPRAAGGNNNNPLGGLGGLDFGSLLSNPAIQNMMSSLGANRNAGGDNGAAAGANNNNPLAGLDFGSLLNNPSVQNMMSSLGGGANNAANEDGGAVGANNGAPNISEMLNNPEVRQAAQNMLPNIGNILNNPAVMDMANNILQNPEMMNSLLSSFGGLGGNKNQ